MLGAIFRQGNRRALIHTFRDGFRVSWQGNVTEEVSKPILAIAATAVSHQTAQILFTHLYMTIQIHGALLNHQAGESDKFTADVYASVYDCHIALLTEIEAKNVNRYHGLMRRLFGKIT